jgi:predicted transcriptional regulator
MTDNTFFCEDHIKVLLQKLKENPSKIDRTLLYDYIRSTAPTNVYRVSKETGFAYTSIKAIFRELKFVGLISSTTKINKNNQAVKEYFIQENQND